MRGDYGRLDFADYDVVFAYLSPAAMPALWSKARAEMRPGTLLLSYEFPIPGVQSHVTSSFDARGCAVYGWHM
jgi:predicted O-methyltransferase YrrM